MSALSQSLLQNQQSTPPRNHDVQSSMCSCFAHFLVVCASWYYVLILACCVRTWPAVAHMACHKWYWVEKASAIGLNQSSIRPKTARVWSDTCSMKWYMSRNPAFCHSRFVCTTFYTSQIRSWLVSSCFAQEDKVNSWTCLIFYLLVLYWQDFIEKYPAILKEEVITHTKTSLLITFQVLLDVLHLFVFVLCLAVLYSTIIQEVLSELTLLYSVQCTFIFCIQFSQVHFNPLCADPFSFSSIFTRCYF